jgi:hypothetical protein
MGLSVVAYGGLAGATGNGTGALGGYAINNVAQTGNTNYLGVWGWAEAAVSVPSGVHTYYGMNSQARVDGGVTGVTGLVSLEADVGIQASGAALDKFGVAAVSEGDDVIHGSRNEAAFAAWAGGSSGGWNNIFQITNYGGASPVNSNSVLFSTVSSATVKSFIDFSSYGCSGGYEIKFSNNQVDCSGNVYAPAYYPTGSGPLYLIFPSAAGASSNGANTVIASQNAGTGTNQTGGSIVLNPGSLTGSGVNGIVTVKPQGSAGNTVLRLDTVGSSSSIGDYLEFWYNGTQAWVIGNAQNSPNQFYIFDQAGGHNDLQITASGAMDLMPNGGLVTDSGGLESKGTTFTVTGCGTAGSVTGGAEAGSFTVGTGASTCTFVITIAGATGATAAHGWACAGSDETAKIVLAQSAHSTTTCTLYAGSTVTTGDTITWGVLRGF